LTTLADFNHFGAAHWETGSVRHILNYQGADLSEALLLGISGGICVGYFTFAYKGVDPHVALLTRNTFDPLDTLLDRLGVIREVRQTTNAEKGAINVLEALDDGQPALVFADTYSLHYNALPTDSEMWLYMPLVVYGLDVDYAYLSDRSATPLQISAQELDRARGRTKLNKYKMMTLELPNLDKLARAVKAGIEGCLRLYTELPPKGARTNFGFAALDHWADMLVKKTGKSSWAKVFPRGRSLFAGLTTTYDSIKIFGTGGQASREQYAAFLDEASAILNKPLLRQAGELFRKAAPAWDDLAVALLPDHVEPFQRTRALKQQKLSLFNQYGAEKLAERQAIQAQLQKIKDEMSLEFPLDERGCAELLAAIREKVLAVRAIEWEAVFAIEDAMSNDASSVPHP
jgi:hypothetical protein